MSTTTIPPAILDTILTNLALIFLTGAHGSETAARDAAGQMLAAYNPETPAELRLAANIVSFSFHALEALSQSATPDMPLTRVLRLRGSAVSLSRESHKAERRLEQVQKARHDGIPAQPEPAEQSIPAADKALDLIADTRNVAAAAQQTQQTWTQAYRQRQRDQNLAKQRARRQSTPIPRAATDPSVALP
jgi:hypothetical protein